MPPSPRFDTVAIIAALFAVALTAMGIHWMEMELGLDYASEAVMAVPALWVMLVVVLAVTVGRQLVRRQMLNRQQLLAMAFAAVLAAPVCTQGFWHRMFGIITTLPRGGEVAKMEAMSDRLWPHGPDLAAGRIPVTVLGGGAANAVGADLPVDEDGATPGAPYLVSFLVEAPQMGAGEKVSLRFVGDGGKEVVACVLEQPSRPDFLRADKFQRIGAYNVIMPPATAKVRIEVKLTGKGPVTVGGVKVQSVAAIEGMLAGRTSADRGLLAAHRGVHWREWADPLIAWTTFLAILFGATFAINAVMRRQWIEAERFSLPVGRAWSLLVGGEEGQTPVWRNRWLWGSAALTAAWCLLRWMAALDPAFPNLSVSVNLGSYINSPAVGQMFNVSFTLSAIILGTALFFELNLLASMLVGFWLFRAMYWYGEQTGVATDPSYPWASEQQVGAYMAYGLFILLLARRHLWSVARLVVTGRWAPDEGEVLSPRLAAILFCAAAGGAVAWGAWTGISIPGLLALMAFLLLVGVVASRLRAESGLLFSMFSPGNASAVLIAMGGIATFGADVVLLGFIASFFLAANIFFIPGAQLELIEFAKRDRIRPLTTGTVCMVGVVGAMVIGGWFFLTTCFSAGSDHLPYGWAFDTKPWYLATYNAHVVDTAEGQAGNVTWSGYIIGFVGTGGVAAIRQFWPGFALHPAGMLFGPSQMLWQFWGSVAVALVVRWAAVRFGGAVAVRNYIQPVAIGMLVGSALAYAWIAVHVARIVASNQAPPGVGGLL